MSTVIATAQAMRPRRPSRKLATAILIVGLVAVGVAAPGEASAGPKPTTSWYISPPRTTITPGFIADIRAKGKALGADVATSAAGDYPLHRATVMLDFGTPRQRAITTVGADEMRQHLLDGQFPEGSMGPKVRAALQFLDAGGGCAVITRPWLVPSALSGDPARATRIVRGMAGRGVA